VLNIDLQVLCPKCHAATKLVEQHSETISVDEDVEYQQLTFACISGCDDRVVVLLGPIKL
jgi:hypothetical protein